MADYVERALETVEEADSRIRALIDEAVANRCYGQLRELACIAEQIAEILDSLGAVNGAALKQPREQQGHNPGCKENVASMICQEKSNAVTGPPSPRTKRTGDLSVSTFPLFVGDGDALVKIGRSNAGSSTYEHRIPKEAVDTVVRRVLSLCSGRDRKFTAEGLSDVRTQGDSKKVPGYQLYLCLGWLKREGLIKQTGRKGYSVVDPDTFMGEVEKAWSSLDHRQ